MHPGNVTKHQTEASVVNGIKADFHNSNSASTSFPLNVITSWRSRITIFIGESRSSQQEILFPIKVRTAVDQYNQRTKLCQDKL